MSSMPSILYFHSERIQSSTMSIASHHSNISLNLEFQQLYNSATEHLLLRQLGRAYEDVLRLLELTAPPISTCNNGQHSHHRRNISSSSASSSSSEVSTFRSSPSSSPRKSPHKSRAHSHHYPQTPSNPISAWIKTPELHIKSLKLFITIYTSLIIDQLAGNSAHQQILPILQIQNRSDGRIDKSTLNTCIDALIRETIHHTSPSSALSSSSQPSHTKAEIILSALPPSLLETLLLSILKLSISLPSNSSGNSGVKAILDKGRGISEDYLAELSSSPVGGDVVDQLLSSSSNTQSRSLRSSTHFQAGDPEIHGHSKALQNCIKLYILEFLPRLGEWELAREVVLGGGMVKKSGMEVSIIPYAIEQIESDG